MIKEFLTRLSTQRAPGPYPSFTIFDLLKAIELVAEKGPIGRGKLAEELNTGEGTTRTLIERLKGSGLIAVSKMGCSITEKGYKLWKEICSIIPQKVRLPKNDLTFAMYSTAVLVKDRGDRVKHGLEQRDAAVKVGARGATTLIFTKEKLVIPMVSNDLARDFPVAYNQITDLMKLEENDVIVIGSADDQKKAEYGALAAAWTLI